MSAAIYLFTGPEIGGQNDEIDRLRIQARQGAAKAGSALDEYLFYAGDAHIPDVVSLLENESLFASARFIVLRGAESVKDRADVALIAGWAGSEQSVSTLILVSSEFRVDKKLEDCVPNPNQRIFWELFDNQKEQWIRDFFRRSGYSITPDAVEAILGMVENNTQAFRTECARFFPCFEKGRTITEEDVEQILEHNREESPFTLFEALADPGKAPAARLEQAALILRNLRAGKENSAVPLIAGLAYCFRKVLDWHRLTAEKPAPGDLDLKAAGFAKKRDQVQYRTAARVWSPVRAAAILALLSQTDANIRGGLSGLDNVLLDVLLYKCV
ncbi:MAG: DNA polymerase III subunit delta [Spirochaetaceae bacterium]|jgi:DNA polymerase-3 subunit delta|nr:DNA polymerase III subunit delta [Spirochaetaceae bacterium]